MIQCLWERPMIQLSLRVSYDTVVSRRVSYNTVVSRRVSYDTVMVSECVL